MLSAYVKDGQPVLSKSAAIVLQFISPSLSALNVDKTSSSAIAERPRCRVGQFWPNITGRQYFADITAGLASTTVT